MKIGIKTTEQYGVKVQILDAALSDEFDDFLSEGEYVLYNMRSAQMDDGDAKCTEFLFGKLADAGKVSSLVKQFALKAALSLNDCEV
jgi:hypothetical protein